VICISGRGDFKMIINPYDKLGRIENKVDEILKILKPETNDKKMTTEDWEKLMNTSD